jgi:hypothetical protein
MKVNGQLYPYLLYPLGMRLGGPQDRSGCCGEEKNMLALQPISLCYTDLATNYLQMSLLDILHGGIALYFIMFKGGWHVEALKKM